MICILGDLVTHVDHKQLDGEYEQCKYLHKRSVKWLKQIDLWTDVYLSTVLRPQQALSDITKYVDLVFRNLYPYYISDDGLHLTMYKKTSSEFRIKDNISLQCAILDINSSVMDYYGEKDHNEEIVIKTAVGSPGFIEIILPYIPISVVTGILVFQAVIGKYKSSDGTTASGLMALLSKGSELLNDHVERQKLKAEVRQIEANAAKTQAETLLIKAQARKENAEASVIENSIKNSEEAVTRIADKTNLLHDTATQCGIEFDSKAV